MIDIDKAKEAFAYDPETGVFTRKIVTGPHCAVGDVVGSRLKTGHLNIRLRGEQMLAHRLAWILHYGREPQGVIDHINGDPADNRICNLRDVPQRANVQNVKLASKNSKTGFMGVFHADKKFEARIMAKGKLHLLGRFDTPEAAYQVYLDAKRRLHEGCTI